MATTPTKAGPKASPRKDGKHVTNHEVRRLAIRVFDKYGLSNRDLKIKHGQERYCMTSLPITPKKNLQ